MYVEPHDLFANECTKYYEPAYFAIKCERHTAGLYFYTCFTVRVCKDVWHIYKV